MNEFEKKINELCFHYTLNLIFKDNLINLKKELNKFNNKNEIKMNLYFSISQSIIYPFTDILLDLYHTELKTNSMLGNNSSERLKSFVSEFEQDHWEKINLTYPVFFSTSELIVNDTTEYVSKILSNLINDNAELLSKFKIDYQKLLDIRLGKGDTHSGKSVAKLMFRSPDEKNLMNYYTNPEVIKQI
ncbi:DUF4135 domain-containing protein [Latilactobacillus sakei]|uniref:DUF4135 domain-containing protein n=1 Tax=Latilactobacillus sakei TaxID=1599 RepID=UPI00202DE653|nr:DUF4135 domain-containing protein [Latilactobacillus sakei]MCM1636300.1 DUF4135 domain-containing protein [Latilactobacillus sakei]